MIAIARMALGLAGVPDVMVADIEKAIPGAERIITAAKTLKPMIEEAMPHIEALEPIWDKAWPIIKAEYPDLVGMLPLASEILAFVDGKKTA